MEEQHLYSILSKASYDYYHNGIQQAKDELKINEYYFNVEKNLSD